MTKHTHIHLHLRSGLFGSETTADAGAFTESKHKRSGGQFASQSGASVAKPATGGSAYAAKHAGSREAEEAKRQAEHEKAKADNPML